jgi:hypothetical protein
MGIKKIFINGRRIAEIFSGFVQENSFGRASPNNAEIIPSVNAEITRASITELP